MKVNSFINFDTTSLTADPLSVGQNQRTCAVGARTWQRNTTPSLYSSVRLNFYFLAPLNLLQLSSWICCVCILLPNLLWHNSLSLHIYSLLFPILAHIVTNRWTNQVNLRNMFTVAENKSIHIKKRKAEKKKNVHWIAVSLMHSAFSWDFVR